MDQQNVRKAMVTYRLQAYKSNVFIKVTWRSLYPLNGIKKANCLKRSSKLPFSETASENITTICKLKSQQLPNIKYIIKQQTLWYM